MDNNNNNNNNMLDIEDMPKFLNNLAADYFEENRDIQSKLFACAFTIALLHGLKK